MVKVSLDLLIDRTGGVGRALHRFPGSLLTANLTGGARSIQSRTIRTEVLLEDLLLESGYCRATRIISTSLCLPRGCRRSCEGYFSHRCVYVYISRELFVSREIELDCRRDPNDATNVLGVVFGFSCHHPWSSLKWLWFILSHMLRWPELFVKNMCLNCGELQLLPLDIIDRKSVV